MSEKRQSRASTKRKSKAGSGQRKSMKRQSVRRKSSKGAGASRRKSMGAKSRGKKSSVGERAIGNKMARRGRDKLTFPNGDIYEGDWLAVFPDIFVRDGEGTYICNDGTAYYGLWELDVLQTGSISWPCGQKYSGDFRDQQMFGIGTYTFPGRGELSGTFANNLPVGNVVFLDMAGMKYIGRIEPNAQSVRLKMLNHLLGGFSKEDLILPEPPKGAEEEDEIPKEKKDSKGSRRGSKRKSRRQSSRRSSQKRKSKSTGKRQSMKKRQSSVKKK